MHSFQPCATHWAKWCEAFRHGVNIFNVLRCVIKACRPLGEDRGSRYAATGFDTAFVFLGFHVY
jgi:hypothetical protein